LEVHVIRPSIVILVICAAAVAAGEEEFSLDLDTIDLSRRDARTEARLAGWNSPMGRLMYNMNEQQSMLLRGGMPGGGSGGLALRAQLRAGVGMAIVAATVDAGVAFYERSVEVVEWPWRESTGSVMPIEEQLSLLLGRRIEHSVGGKAQTPEKEERPPDEGRPSVDN
jgi:hypothetical protein